MLERSTRGGRGEEPLGNMVSGLSGDGQGSFSREQESAQVQPDLLSEEDGDSWRREVSERLHRYHARRRPRAPRYPSLRLKFDTPEASWGPATRDMPVSPQAVQQAATASVNRQAVAREYIEPVTGEPTTSEVPAEVPRRRFHEPAAKVIEFPRTMYAPAVQLHDLAEPILNRPRILEA